jgi:D-beta-D-heptose 7-phosphate kinase/D-beta-D-heptose 1-phosphate adenosyltransferase
MERLQRRSMNGRLLKSCGGWARPSLLAEARLVIPTIPDFSALRVLIAGDAMLDEYWFGDAGRISPEAPVPIVKAQATDQRPGGAANVALNVAALGAQAHLLAVVGADARGKLLEQRLIERGVRCSFVRSATLPTIHKLRVLARNQQLIRLDAEQPLGECAAELEGLFDAALADADVLVLSDYGKGTLSRVSRLIAAARRAGVPVLVDPKGRNFSAYRGATLLTPNQAEFETVAGAWTDERQFLRKADALRAELDLELLLVTRGGRGMTLVAREQATVTLAAEAREVFDVTGAGDTVIALMAAALGAGLAGEEAATLANLAAGLVVGKIGVAGVTRGELSLALHRRGSGGRGLVDAEQLQVLVREAQGRGERIVMTNGCFDILHAGHVSYLEEAKSLADHLIVAVNDDASVARLKGPGRPLTRLADRMAVLAGLAAVDWVVPFSEDTPAALIERVLPDLLVKGGDYRAEEIAGGDAVLRHGGEVRVLSLKEGRSTSALLAAIRATRE